MSYTLRYRQPYGHDDHYPTSPQISTVLYKDRTVGLSADDDVHAEQEARDFLADGGLQVESHDGGFVPGLYSRQFICLHQITGPREVQTSIRVP